MSLKVDPSLFEAFILDVIDDYEIASLTVDELSSIDQMRLSLITAGKNDKSQKLIQARAEYNSCAKKITALSMAIDKNHTKIEKMKAELSGLREQLKGKANILDVEKQITSLIKNLSTPAAIIAYALSGGTAAVIPVVTHIMGEAADEAIADKLEEVEEKKSPEIETPIILDDTSFSFRNNDKDWYKSLLELINEESDKTKPSSLVKLVDALNTNDIKEYKLEQLSKLFKIAMERAEEDKGRLEKKLSENGYAAIFVSVLDSSVKKIPSISQVVTGVGGFVGNLGRAMLTATKTDVSHPQGRKRKDREEDIEKKDEKATEEPLSKKGKTETDKKEESSQK